MLKKVVLPGLVAGVVALAVGMIVSALISVALPVLNAQYQNPGLFRPWSDPKMSIYFAYPFLLGLGLAYVWDRIKNVVPGNIWQRAWSIMIGMLVVSTIPGMTISYSSIPISLLMTFSWTVTGLVSVFFAAAVIAKMNG
jgi:hypothetical protein